MTHRPVTPEEREQAIALARDGVSYREIAARHERPQGTVSRILSDAILEGRLSRRYVRESPRTGDYYYGWRDKV